MKDADRVGGSAEPAAGLSAAEAEWIEERQWFRRWLEGAMFARRSQETYVERTGAFLRWLWSRAPESANVLTSAVDRDEAVAAFVAQLRNTSTVNVTLAALNSYFTWKGWDETTVDSVTRLRRVLPPLAAVERSRCLDEAALRRSRDYALFVMGLATGLRESELAALEVDDVVLQAHSGSVRAPGPDDVERVVPLAESARRVQLTWFADRQRLLGKRQRRGFFLRAGLDGPLSTRRVDEIVRSIGEVAGVRNLSPGVLRNTFEQDLRDQGLDEQEIAYLMGRAQPDPARARALRRSGAASLSTVTPSTRRRARRLPAVAGEQLQMEF